MPLPYLIIGNLENRRVQLFQRALINLSQPIPYLLSHLDIILQPDKLLAIPDIPLLVRIDALGENYLLEKALLKLGYIAAMHENAQPLFSPEAIDQLHYHHGQLIAPRQYYLGFIHYLKQLEHIFQQKKNWYILNDIQDIILFFDKRKTAHLYQQADIPIPPFISAIKTVAQLHQAMQIRDWSEVFVKMHAGSSASGLAYYFYHKNKQRVMTTLYATESGWFNHLKINRLDKKQLIENALNFILQQGAHIEKAIAKAKLNKAFFDCRVLVIAGEPLFIVIRQSHHIITNLHLGGWRGDINAFKQIITEEVFMQIMATCQKVYQLHRSLHIGLDILIEKDYQTYRVIEANAFGDLLPHLSYQGLDVYSWEIKKAEDWLAYYQ